MDDEVEKADRGNDIFLETQRLLIKRIPPSFGRRLRLRRFPNFSDRTRIEYLRSLATRVGIKDEYEARISEAQGPGLTGSDSLALNEHCRAIVDILNASSVAG